MRVEAPISNEVAAGLRAGDAVWIHGIIYVARDAAHKRLVDALGRGEALPFDPLGAVIYYMGPSPAKPGQPIGSAGPTTSYRMDPYTPTLLAQGVKGLIGKGSRSEVVKKALCEHQAVYFAAVGGAAALIAKTVQESEIIAYPDLGAEAVLRLKVAGFPAIVVNDAQGGDLYEAARKEWARK
ncbi:MAG: Fe-S-containing hydro-lyase [Chloroflexi bacterium]|nr:Fe-S-containing hydro-lyase [Chloroflexota bacterium]MCL4467049.1 Fe-S-containing hydro-lyase [Chloroflexota bacterium]MCL5110059.1 Fe-S-containing hydro-lyase [Chloroflexota bacterium]